MTEDLSALIKHYKKEIWEWQQKESEWIKTQNQLDGNKRIIEELSTKIIEMNDRLKSALDINDEHQRYNGDLQVRLSEALEDNKRLSKQIEDYREMLRKAGL
jgi:hypothetical protein